MNAEVKIQLSEHAREEIDQWIEKFPEGRQRSAVIAALHIVQHENQGYLTPELMNAVAAYLDMAVVQVFEVATFYSMFETEKVGRNCVAVCTNICCMVRGSEKIIEHIEKKYGIKEGESTDDGVIFLKKEEECLAACTGAPMMMVNHRYYENLTPAKVDEILEGLE
jgi:NADH-quinone oxidoreductase subunit E